jgi:hypothetical protein
VVQCPFRMASECLGESCAVYERMQQKCAVPLSALELREISVRLENVESHLEDVNDKLYQLVEFEEERR